MNSIAELVEKPVLCLELKSGTKEEAMREMVAALANAFPGFPSEAVLVALQQREQLSSTGIGEGLAIPHCRLGGLRRIHLAIGRHSSGIPFNSADGRPVHLIFLIAGPESAATDLLKLLAKISRVLKVKENRAHMMEQCEIQALGEFVEAQSRAV